MDKVLTPVEETEEEVFVADRNAMMKMKTAESPFKPVFMYDVAEGRPKTAYNAYVPKAEDDDSFLGRIKRDILDNLVDNPVNMAESTLKGVARGVTEGVPNFAANLYKEGVDLAASAYNAPLKLLIANEEKVLAGLMHADNAETPEGKEAVRRSAQKIADLENAALANDEYADSINLAVSNVQKQWAETLDGISALKRDEADNALFYDLGSGATSLAGAVGLAFFTKNPMTAAKAFGLGAQSSFYNEMRSKGSTVSEALAFSIPHGAAQAALERVGVHIFVENMAVRGMGSAILRNTFSEAVQEASQQGAEGLVRAAAKGMTGADVEAPESVSSFLYDCVYAGVLGAAVSVPVSAGGALGSRRRARGAAQELEQAGMESDDARATAGYLVYNDRVGEFSNALSEAKATGNFDRALSVFTQYAETVEDKTGKKFWSNLEADRKKEFLQSLIVPTQKYVADAAQIANDMTDPDTFDDPTPEGIAKNFAETLENYAASTEESISDALDRQLEAIAQAEEKTKRQRAVLDERQDLSSTDKKVIGDMLEAFNASVADKFGADAVSDLSIKTRTPQVNVEKQEEFAERAGMYEYEQGLTRAEAERLAMRDVFGEEQSEANAFVNTYKSTQVYDDIPFYQRGEDERDLVVQHAVTLGKLEEALELGAMPMPSLAVTKSAYAGVSDFGEIILVGGSDVIDPARNRDNRTFSADIYSTRKISPVYEINEDGRKYLKSLISETSRKSLNYWVENVKQNLESGNDSVLRELFLASTGKITDLDGRSYTLIANMSEQEKSDFAKWKRKFVAEYTDRRIFEGFTPSGYRKFSPYDLNNILRLMKKENLKGSESLSNGNAHALRGVWAEELKSIEEIRKRKGLIVDAETYKNLDNAIWDETTKLSDLLVTEQKAEELERIWVAPDEYMIEEVLKGLKPNSNIKASLERAGLRSDKKAVDAVKKYMKLLKATPVQYFESKPQRAVGFEEFAGAIMPTAGEYDNAAKELEERGLKVVRSDDGGQAVSEFKNVFFQKGTASDLVERSGGPKIADDTETVDVVEIPKNAVPKFEKVSELVKWIKDSLGDERTVTIRSTGQNILISNAGINRSVKKRGDVHNIAYSRIKELFSNSKYSGFEEADSRHPNIKGQDVYHSAMIIGETPYSVRFKVDVPLNEGTFNYADHAVTEIEIAPARHLVLEDKSSVLANTEAIHTISMGVLRGKVKPARLRDGRLNQRNTVRSDVIRGAYDPSERILYLFKNADPSTIVHELGHHFTMQYIRLLRENGREDELKGILDWLGAKSADEITVKQWEKLADAFIVYTKEGFAPSSKLDDLFAALKKYLTTLYEKLVTAAGRLPEINDEVREFFDTMMTVDNETQTDFKELLKKSRDLREIVKGVLRGEALEVNGLSVDDVKALVRQLHARMPRAPKTLEQKIRRAGGIDIDFARSFDLIPLMGASDAKFGKHGLFRRNGAIADETQLTEFLKSEGYIQEAGSERETSAQWDEAVKVLENAGTTYSPADVQQMRDRENAEAAVRAAQEALSGIDYDALLEGLSAFRSVGAVAASKDMIRYIDGQLKRIQSETKRLNKKLVKEARQDVARAVRKEMKQQAKEERDTLKERQKEIVALIRSLPLENKDGLISSVNKAFTAKSLSDILEEVKAKAESYYETEKRRRLKAKIDNFVKKTRPKSTKNQKFDYERNKLFERLREYSKLTQEKATAELERLNTVGEGQSAEDLLITKYLTFKSEGMRATSGLMQSLLFDLESAAESGRYAKEQTDFTRRWNLSNRKTEIASAVAARAGKRGDKAGRFRTKAGNFYRAFTNIYSMLNSIGGKKLADEYGKKAELLSNEVDTAVFEKISDFSAEALKVLGLKSYGDMLDTVADLKKKKVTLTYQIEAMDGATFETDALGLLDAYNAIKNKRTREDYARAFGSYELPDGSVRLTIEDLIDENLTAAQKEWADLMMETVNSYYDALNRTFISLYGTDLPKVENYWPATSEHYKETELEAQFIDAAKGNPSFIKERAKGGVIPRPVDVYSKFLKHVKGAENFTRMGVFYKDLRDAFNSLRVSTAIKNVYGDGVYRELMKLIDNLWAFNRQGAFSKIESAVNAAVNNWVMAKISVNPSVYVTQLTGMLNYLEQVPVADYVKGFVEGLSHPKETAEYMVKNAPFLNARFAGGYNEALQRVLNSEETGYTLGVFSPKMKYNARNAMSFLVRLGDKQAIVYGGYAFMKYMTEKKGLSVEEAAKEFEFATLRAQSSGTAGSLSNFQASRSGLARLLLAFKNTPMQFMRKVVDAWDMYQNGDISAAEFAKTEAIYIVGVSASFVLAKYLFNQALDALTGAPDDDDDEEKLLWDMMFQISFGTLDGIPFAGDAAKYLAKSATGQARYYDTLISMPVFDDLERAARKLGKKDKTVWDAAEIMTPALEIMTAAPVGTAVRYAKRAFKEEE